MAVLRLGDGKFSMDLVIYGLLLITYTSRAVVRADREPVFSEGGVPYALEEEILEELAKGQQEQRGDEKDFVGISAGKTQSKSDESIPEPKEPPVKEPPPKEPPVKDPPVKEPMVKEPPPKEPPAPPHPHHESPSDPTVQKPASAPNPAASSNAKQQYEDLKSAAAAAIMKTANVLQNQPKQPIKQKKEGQEEFATFVDPFSSQPAQNRRMMAEKQTHAGHFGHESKRAQHEAVVGKSDQDDLGDTVFIAVTTVCSAAAVFGLIGAGVCWYRLHKQYRAAQEVEYPHYGVTGPAKERTSGSSSPVAAMDAKLASSAQLYHYQHTKQQIIAMENSTSDAKGQESEDSEGEGDEGDFSVYECPGLAPTGDIEVSNPLFENVSSPHAKTAGQHEPSPRVHQSPVKGEDP